jgi:hypothetical protein
VIPTIEIPVTDPLVIVLLLLFVLWLLVGGED